MGCLQQAHCGSATICSSLPWSHYRGHYSPQLARVGEPLLRNIIVAASRRGRHVPRGSSAVARVWIAQSRELVAWRM